MANDCPNSMMSTPVFSRFDNLAKRWQRDGLRGAERKESWSIESANVPRVRGIVRRYGSAAALMLLLVLAHQMLLQSALSRLGSDAPVINIAGRQRMLSQKLAKSALELLVDANVATRTRIHAELSETLQLWEDSHFRLRSGENSRESWNGNSPSVIRAFDKLDHHFHPMDQAARRLDQLLAREDAVVTTRELRPDVGVIVEESGLFLAQMDAIVSLYTQEARDRVRMVSLVGWMLLGAGLLALGVMAIKRESAQQRTRQLADQLAHAGRLNALGEMASSLAHEINQPLGAIANYAGGCLSLLERETEPPSALREAIERIAESASRAGNMVRRMKGFAKQGQPAAARSNVEETLDEVFQLCRPEAEQLGVRLESSLGTGPLWAAIDGIQLQQVLVNLISNGFHALGDAKREGGRVLVTCEVRPDGSLHVEVSDNGPGIPAEHQQRIFEPFFTTRAEGTGLGLAISRTIIENHGGKIWIQSAPGRGAVFRFRIPGGGRND